MRLYTNIVNDVGFHNATVTATRRETDCLYLAYEK